jgi:hypothetical protein
MQVYIKHLAKDLLLYELWKAARNSPNLYHCSEMRPTLTYEVTKSDINYMIDNNRKIDVTTYYGRMLYIDISGDYVDVLNYDIYNGRGAAQKIIDKLKERELQKSVCVYFKFF